VREWAEYQRVVRSGAWPVAGSEDLTDSAVELEELYLGLRTTDGSPEDRVKARVRQAWIESGWAILENGRVRLTAEGWLRLDALVASI
jgi:coproporphyrinogen III oxidase-like Fe-S oxidoreductase